jgi:hypothetical protein
MNLQSKEGYMKKWKPIKPEGHWMEWLVSNIQDQGTWGTSYVRYQLDKRKKIAHVVAKNRTRPPQLVEIDCQRMSQAFGAIGWQVLDGD